MNSNKSLDNPQGNSSYIGEFTSREKQVLRHLIKGASNKEIARDLGIGESTVRVHVKSLFRKMHVSNRTQAAVWALNNGFASL
jgi:two-component system nitrate/nitrite response regulator NarL